MTTLQTTISIDGVETDVTVRYTYHKASRGARDSLGGVAGAGPALEPDEPADVEIEDVKTKCGLDVLDCLSDCELDEVQEKCLEQETERFCAIREFQRGRFTEDCE